MLTSEIAIMGREGKVKRESAAGAKCEIYVSSRQGYQIACSGNEERNYGHGFLIYHRRLEVHHVPKMKSH